MLHAVSDVRAALRNLHGLLAPGGSLIFMDTATPQLWTETVFGLTSGWWRFTDRDLRPEQPLLKREQWETVLRETGFVETTSLPGLTGPTGGEGQIGLLARKSYEEASVPVDPTCERRRRNHGSFSRTPRESVMHWFRDCANMAPDAASLGEGDRFEFDGDDAFTCDRGRWRTGKQLVKDCQIPHRSASFIFGISMQQNGADMVSQSGRIAPSYPGARMPLIPQRSCASTW